MLTQEAWGGRLWGYKEGKLNRIGVSKLWPMGKSGPPPVFIQPMK